MKISHATISPRRRRAGILLMECMVYISVFAILTGIGFASFYFCWDHTRAVIFTAGEIESVVRAGETWRADVRSATGKISAETNGISETVRIPAGQKEIVYRFNGGELRREISGAGNSSVLAKIKSSEMKPEPRGTVLAWRWEIELSARRQEAHLPLKFTFESAQKPP